MIMFRKQIISEVNDQKHDHAIKKMPACFYIYTVVSAYFLLSDMQKQELSQIIAGHAASSIQNPLKAIIIQ
jgi:hypothetical protein